MGAVADLHRPALRLENRCGKGHLELIASDGEEGGDVEPVAAVLVGRRGHLRPFSLIVATGSSPSAIVPEVADDPRFHSNRDRVKIAKPLSLFWSSR